MFDAISSSAGFSTIRQPHHNVRDEAALGNFQKLLDEAASKSTNATKSEKDPMEGKLREAAKQMEIQMVTMMFREMEKASTENGLLGGRKSEGMNHFKDMFLEDVAREVVNSRGLGFTESLVNAYKTNHLTV